MSLTTHSSGSGMEPVELAFLLSSLPLRDDQWQTVEREVAHVDLDELFDIARRLGVGPLVVRLLADREGLPEQISRRAAVRRRDIITRNLRLSGELSRVVSALDDAGVDALPYKGPVLAEQAYDDLASRSFSDLDLFVARESVPAACRALESLGFTRVQTRATPEQIVADESVIRLPREFKFKNGEVVVEIRWQFGNKSRPAPISFADCWERRTEMSVAGETIPTLSLEDTLIILARHGAKHHWNRLGWIVDIAALVHNTNVEWDVLLTRADELNLRRVVESCLLLTAEITDTDVPEEILESARDDTHVEEVVESSKMYLATNPSTAAYSRDHQRRLEFETRLCDSWRERLGYLGRIAFEPMQSDYEFLPLPRRLHGFYYGLRPIRIAAMAAKSIVPGTR